MFIRLGSHLHHVQIDGPAEGGVVKFANSLGTDLRIWDEVVKPLTGSLRTIRYDMRGHGLTPATEPPYSIAHLAEDLERCAAPAIRWSSPCAGPLRKKASPRGLTGKAWPTHRHISA
jgi:hypothetical protein